jgi:uncharacterized protein
MTIHHPLTRTARDDVCATMVETVSGRMVDVLHPKPEMIHFPDIAEALSKIPRFNGHTCGAPYSVAQHCTIGAKLFEDDLDFDAARAFLLHDAHEAFMGDMATPVAAAMSAASELDLARWKMLKRGLDFAIFDAAGLNMSAKVEARVKEMDARLLLTERNHLMRRGLSLWSDDLEKLEPLQLNGRLRPKPWDIAADEWMSMFRHLFPGVAA